MFDWSRGSLLKAMQQAKIPHATYDPLLKGFAYAWIQSILQFKPGAKVLDVGCGASPFFINDLRQLYRIDAYGMDKSEAAKNVREVYRVTAAGEVRREVLSWGLTEDTARRFPDVRLYDAFAGDGTGPGEYFDAVISVSALEHVYDTAKPIAKDAMYPHYDVLRDMVRMLKPGGLLVLTYDFPLAYPYNPGWSPSADHEFLITLGMNPCYWKRVPISEAFIYNHPDTLFIQPDMILAFCDFLYRIAIMCFAFQKPGNGPTLATYGPHPELVRALEKGPLEHPIIAQE